MHRVTSCFTYSLFRRVLSMAGGWMKRLTATLSRFTALWWFTRALNGDNGNIQARREVSLKAHVPWLQRPPANHWGEPPNEPSYRTLAPTRHKMPVCRSLTPAFLPLGAAPPPVIVKNWRTRTRENECIASLEMEDNEYSCSYDVLRVFLRNINTFKLTYAGIK